MTLTHTVASTDATAAIHRDASNQVCAIAPRLVSVIPHKQVRLAAQMWDVRTSDASAALVDYAKGTLA